MTNFFNKIDKLLNKIGNFLKYLIYLNLTTFKPTINK